MEILKPKEQIYGHQLPQSVEGLRLDNEDSQEGSQPICLSVEVEVETELGLEYNRT